MVLPNEDSANVKERKEGGFIGSGEGVFAVRAEPFLEVRFEFHSEPLKFHRFRKGW